MSGGRLAGALLVAAMVVPGQGCTGEVLDPAGGGGSGTGPGTSSPLAPDLDEPALFGPAGIRRLTQTEIQRTVADVLGLDVSDELSLLPLDQSDEENLGSPFDNDYTLQQSSPALVGGLDLFSKQVAERILSDTARRDALVGCTPAGPGDEACFRSFVERVGRRMIRRPLAAEDVDEMVEHLLPHAVEAGSFDVAVDLALRVFLQHTEFIYRIEVGTPVAPGSSLSRLNDFEVASRLSFLMWGSGPDDALLDAAAEGRLETVEDVQEQALRLLADPRAARQIQTFHAKWMGYDIDAEPGSLDAAFRAETDALVRRVTLEEAGPWSGLFTADQTFVTPRLAEHYGMAPIGSPGWVDGGSNRGGGILSQGAYLSIDSRFGDTSPTFRGRNVLRRLLCRSLPPPPPDVNVDAPPGSPTDCKTERYDMGRRAECAGCHSQMDPIGFGLEGFDAQGRFREVEADLPMCGITGEGAFFDGTAFRGPRELGELIAESDAFESCAVRQFYRFAIGRSERPEDESALEALEAALENEGDFVGLVLAFVGSEAFLHRVADPTL